MDNVFNRSNHCLLLWNVRHRWKKASQFVFNWYRHLNVCLLRDDPGKPVHVIHSKDGTIQGNVFGGSSYAISMLPLEEKMRREIPTTLQPWFTDNSASGGAAKDNTACLNYLMDHGPQYGYFPSPAKSWYICKKVDEPLAVRGKSKVNFLTF